MINAHDLRIGNFLQLKTTRQPTKVIEISESHNFTCKGYKRLAYHNFEGIPLTDTILKDSGFELTRDSMLTFRKDDFSVKLVFDSENCYVQFWHKSDWHDHKLIPCHSTEFVHDLQNAYYMATGANLKIVIK